MRLKEILSIFLGLTIPIGYSYSNQKSLELPVMDEGYYQRYKGEIDEEENKSLLDKEWIWKYKKLEGLEKIINEHDMNSRIKSILNENLNFLIGPENINKQEMEKRIDECFDKYAVVSLTKRTLYFFEKNQLKKEYHVIPGNFAPEIYLKNMDDLKEEEIKESISKHSQTPVGVFILKEIKHWPKYYPTMSTLAEERNKYGEEWVKSFYSKDEKGYFLPSESKYNPLGEYAGRLFSIKQEIPENIYQNIIQNKDFEHYITSILIHTPYERVQDKLEYFEGKKIKSHGCVRTPEQFMGFLYEETQNREKGMFVFIVP